VHCIAEGGGLNTVTHLSGDLALAATLVPDMHGEILFGEDFKVAP